MRYSFFTPVLALTLIALSVGSQAQTCNPAITADAPNTRYTAYTNGTVQDKQTGLVWKRCAEGQTWLVGGCTGSAESFTWQEALAAAERSSFAGKTDWRLPNINSLQSLVERRCFNPAINLAMFPNVPEYWFWSSSAHAGKDFFGNSHQAWAVEFVSGGERGDRYRDENNAVRLVRAGQ